VKHKIGLNQDFYLRDWLGLNVGKTISANTDQRL